MSGDVQPRKRKKEAVATARRKKGAVTIFGQRSNRDSLGFWGCVTKKVLIASRVL